MRKRSNLVYIACIGLLAFTSVFGMLMLHSPSPDTTVLATEYGIHFYIILDAGSGGTRANLMTAQHKQDHIGIDTLDKINSPALTSQKFSEIADSVEVIKKRNGLDKVSGIWVRATAGVRLLPPDERDSVMLRTAKVLAERFPEEFRTADVMSGEYEAINEWDQMNSKHGHVEGTGFGIFVVGGASSQAVFALPETEHTRPNIIAFGHEPIFDGIRYRMYAHSWLGYGQKNVMKTFMDTQVVKKRFFCGCLPDSYGHEKEDYKFDENFIGTSNFGECDYAVQDFVDSLDARCDEPAFYNPCVFGDYFQPHEGIQFRAYGKLWKLARDVATTLDVKAENVTPEMFFEGAKIACALKNVAPKRIPNCFSLIFYHYMMQRMGFHSGNLEFRPESHGWVEGSLRFELSKL